MFFFKNDFTSVELLTKPFCNLYFRVRPKNSEENKVESRKYLCKSNKTCTKKMAKAKDNLNRLLTIDYKPGRCLVTVLEEVRSQLPFQTSLKRL